MKEKIVAQYRRAKAWIFQPRHQEKAEQLCHDVEKAFTEHPAETGETYLQHLWFTIRMAGRFLVTAVVLLTHGLFPFLFVRTASTQIEGIYRIMRGRIPKKRRVEIDSTYDI